MRVETWDGLRGSSRGASLLAVYVFVLPKAVIMIDKGYEIK